MDTPASGLTTLPGERLDCTDAEYFSDHSRVSNTMLNDLRKSPRLYHGYYITGDLQRPASTEAMGVGTLTHAAVLESIDDRFAVLPEGTERRSNKGKAAYAEFIAANKGKTIVKAEAYATALRMCQALRENTVARTLLDLGGETELAIGWTHGPTGLPCKAKLDRLVASHNLIWDLKTTKDPSPDAFAKAVVNFGYMRQAAHYLDAARSLGVDGKQLIVCVRNCEPYEVAVYELDPDALALGEQQISETLEDLQRRMETDDWTADWEKQLTELRLPAWATKPLEVTP